MSYEGLWEDVGCGRRRRFIVRVLTSQGSYPDFSFTSDRAMYRATPSLVYTAVASEPPNERGWSEIAWADVGEIRFWGALAFAIEEGKGFFSFYPQLPGGFGSLWAEALDCRIADRFARRLAATVPQQTHDLHWIKPQLEEVSALYEALLNADNVLLRGVSCYLKSHMLWKQWLFTEEMAIDLYIALEAGLTVLRRRLTGAGEREVSYEAVFDFVRSTFAYGGPLADYWQECHDDRNMLLHPDWRFGAYVMHPMSVDDVWELFDPMLSLYRYLLIGKPRPIEFHNPFANGED